MITIKGCNGFVTQPVAPARIPGLYPQNPILSHQLPYTSVHQLMNKSSVIALGCLVLVGGGLLLGTFQPRGNQASPLRVKERSTVERTPRVAETRKASAANIARADAVTAATISPALPPTRSTETPLQNNLSMPEAQAALAASAGQAQALRLDLAALQAEPELALLTGGVPAGDCALELVNTLPASAYLKIFNLNGLVATAYLRSHEKIQITLHPDQYSVKYASGPASEWRGTTAYFGSQTRFYHDGKFEPLVANQILTLTLFQRIGGTVEGLTPINADDFNR